MLKTYTLFLRYGAGDRFVPVMCETDAEALRRARTLLTQHPECDTIDVFFGDQFLFKIGQPSP